MLEWILTLSQHSTQKGTKMDNSLSAYTQKYDKEGYGLQYPDGHVIRFYERILKYKLSKQVENYLILVAEMECILSILKI